MESTFLYKVPVGCAEEVQKVLNRYRAAKNPKPIKRKLRISKEEFKRGQAVVKQHSALGRKRDRWCDKLANEQERLEDLIDASRTKGDKTWLENKLELLERAIEYAEDA